MAVDLYQQKKHTIVEICDMVGIPTLYAYVREAEGEGMTNSGEVNMERNP
jgi:hypothetical protein